MRRDSLDDKVVAPAAEPRASLRAGPWDGHCSPERPRLRQVHRKSPNWTWTWIGTGTGEANTGLERASGRRRDRRHRHDLPREALRLTGTSLAAAGQAAQEIDFGRLLRDAVAFLEEDREGGEANPDGKGGRWSEVDDVRDRLLQGYENTLVDE